VRRPPGAARNDPPLLSVLVIEDEPAHAELAVRELRRAGFAPDWQRVETEQDYVARLGSPLDLIIADYSLPQFDAPRALQLMQDMGLDVPFIVVSGTVGEAAVASLLKLGATDYLLKDRLGGLGPAVERALEQRRLRREARLAEASLRESEERYRNLFESVPIALSRATPEGRLLNANPALVELLGYPDRDTLLAVPAPALYVDPEVRAQALRVLERDGIVDFEAQMRRRDGTLIWARLTMRGVRAPSGQIEHYDAAIRDVTLRKQAEEERHLLAAIVRSSDDAIYGTTIDGTITSWNAGAEKMFGHSAGEIMGQSASRLYPPDRLDEMMGNRERLSRGEHLTYPETTRLRKDGTRVDVSLTLSPIADTAGKPIGVSTIARDITERLRVEEALRRLAAVVEASDDAIFSVGTDLRITSWNPGAETVFGFSKSEILGRSVSALIPPDRLDEIPQIRERLERGEHLHFDTVRVRKDGVPIHIALTISPIKNTAGRIVGASNVAHDITERRRAEEELRKSEERFRLLARATNDSVWDQDVLTRGVWRGEAFETQFGYPQGTAQADVNWWAEKIHPEDRERVTSGMNGVIEGGGSSWSDEYQFRRADGTYARVYDRGYVLRDTEGRPLRMIGALMDITARKQAEEALRKASEAARVSREKSEFLSRMSHELRTPLNAILGFAQVLEMEPLSPEQQEGIKHILKGGRHLLVLINEVLDIERIEAGRIAIALEPAPFGEIVQETLDLIYPLAAKAGVRVHAEISGAPERSVLADRQRLKQVLLNLLSNGVKYNHPGGSVTLSAEDVSQGRVRIKVSDTGMGISREKMDRLFVPFDRLGAEQKGIEGTGLGLALSKRLVEAMGGTLGAESEEGKGSTFWAELARGQMPVRAPEPEAQAVVLSPAREISSPRTVLCIEDNLSNFELVRHALARVPGIRLLPSMQGQLGLDLAREHQPDLILLDLHLPDIPGDEVLRRLREDPATRRIPVIMISADAMPVQVDRLLQAGACAYLTKPLDIKKFLDQVKQILGEGAPSPAGHPH